MLIRVLPFPLARLLARGVLWTDAKKPVSSAELQELLPGIRYDFNVVAGMHGQMGSFSAVDKPVLLLRGTKSPRFLRQSVQALDGVLPRAQLLELAGLDRSGPWNSNRGGRPAAVADALNAISISPPASSHVR